MTIERKEIRKPHVILCEGRDAEGFLISLLGIMGRREPRFEDFQVFDFKGIKELSPFLDVLSLMEKYNTVRSLIVVRDAEKNAIDSVSSIQHTFFRHSLPVPQNPCELCSGSGNIRTGFVLFPSCSQELQNGTLEDLCLMSLADSNADKVLDDFDGIMKQYVFKREHKNRLHGYFSLTDKYVSMKIGEACKANAFSFDAHPIRSLTNFLLQCCE